MMKKELIVVQHVERVAMGNTVKKELIVGVVSVIQKKHVQVNDNPLERFNMEMICFSTNMF